MEYLIGVYIIRTPIKFVKTKENNSMYNIEYDVKIFNGIVANMKSIVEAYNGYSKEMDLVRRMLDEGITMTAEYLDSITLDDVDDMIEMIEGLIDEEDGLIQEMSNISRSKMILAKLETNKDAVLKDEDFF